MTTKYASYPSLVDRVVVVSGGATGIGAAFVTHFARQDARVAFLDIDERGANALLNHLSDAKHVPVFYKCDVTDLDALRRAIGNIRASLGRIGVLINNAADDERHALAEVNEVMFERNVAVNLRHQVFATREIISDMEALGGGSVVCLGSTGWMKKVPNYPLYAMAKAAVCGFVNGMAHELGKKNIRINALVPGWVITEKQRRLWLDKDSEAELARTQCMPGQIIAEDVARVALFLAADDSHMCAGQSFIVDGGWV